MILVSIVALGVRGLNLGIDFKGGTQIAFETPAPTSLETVRAQAARVGQANAQIQGRGPSTNENYKSFQIRTNTLTTAEAVQLEQDLKESVKADAFGVKNVSSSFGRQIARSAILAIIVSLLLIVGYISLRFQWQFAVPAIVALIHDVLITVGIYALLGREVTTATVAAVLTVLGYSIYDTIIIFDRIRENIPLMKRGSFRQITNVSLWETIPRSLATTFITLLPIVSLLIFGARRSTTSRSPCSSASRRVRIRRSSSPPRCSTGSRSASPSTRAASTRRRPSCSRSAARWCSGRRAGRGDRSPRGADGCSDRGTRGSPGQLGRP